MTIKRLAILTAVVALAVTPAASAAEPPAPAPTAHGIIAILIGQFTPPIGTDGVAARTTTIHRRTRRRDNFGR